MTDEKPEAKILHFPQKLPEPIRSFMRPHNERLMAFTREYKLVGHDVVQITDPDEMGAGFYYRQQMIKETGNDPWRVAFDDCGGVSVSTVFTFINHNFFGSGPPLVFETMVFGGNDMIDRRCERYSTWEEAEQGHQEMLALVRAASTG